MIWKPQSAKRLRSGKASMLQRPTASRTSLCDTPSIEATCRVGSLTHPDGAERSSPSERVKARAANTRVFDIVSTLIATIIGPAAVVAVVVGVAAVRSVVI